MVQKSTSTLVYFFPFWQAQFFYTNLRRDQTRAPSHPHTEYWHALRYQCSRQRSKSRTARSAATPATAAATAPAATAAATSAAAAAAATAATPATAATATAAASATTATAAHILERVFI